MVICLGLAPKKRKNQVSVDDAVVLLGLWALLGFLLFRVGRSKESLFPCKVVVGPLAGGWGDEYAAILLTFFGCGAPNFVAGQMATLRKNKLFDSTMGYPGEDVQQPFPFPSDFFSLIFRGATN